MPEIIISTIPDNRPLAHRKSGKREPLVHVMISAYGDVRSISFPPNRADEIAEAIAKAGRSAKLNKDRDDAKFNFPAV